MPSDAPDPPAPPSTEVPVQRLHPSSLFFLLTGSFRELIVWGAIALWASRDRLEMLAAIFVIPGALLLLLRYYSFRYRLFPHELVINEGLLHRRERHIPYARIQNIDITQNVLHRLFGVAEASLQTGSGAGAEANLRVLSIASIERMRSMVFAERWSGAKPKESAAEVRPDDDEQAATGAAVPTLEATDQPMVLARVPVTDLLLLGLFSGRGLAVVGALWGMAWQLDFFDEERVGQWIERLPLDAESWQVGLVVAVAALSMGLAILVLLSVALNVIGLYGFTLTRAGTELRTQYGLFTRRSFVIPRHRIQVLQVREPWWLRMCGRVSLKVQTAGSSEDQSTQRRSWLLPSLPRVRLPELIDALQVDLPAQAPDSWERLHPAARRRLLRLGGSVALVVAAAAAPWLGAWSVALAAGLLLIVTTWCSVLVRTTVHHLGDQALIARRGVLVRESSIVPVSKVQAVLQHESPFDRRWGMARVTVDTAGSAVAASVGLRLLAVEQADVLRTRLVAAASRTEFRW